MVGMGSVLVLTCAVGVGRLRDQSSDRFACGFARRAAKTPRQRARRADAANEKPAILLHVGRAATAAMALPWSRAGGRAPPQDRPEAPADRPPRSQNL
ncbi:MAG: hypothetical protein AMXMBFR66_32410 [Pseudomonadota bacterium]